MTRDIPLSPQELGQVVAFSIISQGLPGEKLTSAIIEALSSQTRAVYERAAQEIEAVLEESKPWQDRGLLRAAADRVRALKKAV